VAIELLAVWVVALSRKNIHPQHQTGFEMMI